MAKKIQLYDKQGNEVVPVIANEDIERAKIALFDDMWLQAVRTYGSIDRENHPTEPYILEGIPHTYEEAIYTLKFGIGGYMWSANPFGCYNGKVVLMYGSSGGGSAAGNHSFYRMSKVRVIRIVNTLKISAPYSFYDCPELEYVYGYIQWDAANYNQSTAYRGFYQSTKLKHIELGNVGGNLSFENCPLLDLESFKYLVEHRNPNNAAFTVLVHPDVYAKLTDPDNEEWYQLNQDAIAKNITFATA